MSCPNLCPNEGSSALAKALRALDALPAAPTGYSREAGAALSYRLSSRWASPVVIIHSSVR